MGQELGFNSLRLKTVFPANRAINLNRIGVNARAANGEVTGARVAQRDDKAPAPAPTPTTRRVSHHRWVFGAVLGDLMTAVVGAVLAYMIRFQTSLISYGVFGDHTLGQYLGYIAFGGITLVCVLAWQGIYNRGALLRSRWVASRITTGVLIWSAGFLAITLVFKIQPPISRIFMVLNGAGTLVLLLVWRRVYDRYLRTGSRIAALRQRTIFVGWNEDAAHFSRSLKKDDSAVFDIVGWVDTAGAENSGHPSAGEMPRLGDLGEISRILVEQRADMVVLSDLNGPRDRIVELANLCERELVSFKVIPSCFRIFVSGLHLETVAGTPMLGVDRLPLDSTFNVIIKRAIDMIGGTIGLILAAPVIAFFSAMVWAESRGSVFYRQRRTGINGENFEIIKIRSMKLNAEAGTGAKWCVQNDPRRLRVGAFMRKWNIDELPQFWNVIKGEMSLVGPRPERPELIQNFKHEIPHYQARHNAKPGMTGWAQVRGWRGDTDLGERIKCDLWYLENWSLALDLQIMLLTFLRRENAY